MSNFVEDLKARRSQYALTSDSPISDQEIVKLVEDVTVEVPSAFNSQPQRAVVLFGDANQKLWGIVKETLRAVVPDAEAFKSTEAKIDGFAAAHGTVLFYDDADVTAQLQKSFPAYKDNFPGFARDAAGMLQLGVWTALAEKGLGASLQHYNPLIDEAVAAEFGLPSSWKLQAQMPFGAVAQPAGPVDKQPVENRVKVFGL
ncbi:MAG: nitroreductase family protein [Bifidobacterium scardovii]|uniref:nitroreductase family protein n=1 Tax=Bifidobacterium scardovii TaxID=158787 RepID=UPI0006683903|nr:nitroreductase family protein [Bifidobacterium scardovii]MBS6947488.1 nitroreductase family protein [Bifidobacterium scardovii]MDU3736803.1 nitroreductase family protein [Bifidobacterium scardovii]MDU5296150.1 nitroreductase family protein [Bifidobacterium scardovii]MDU5610810.1 nitroreductase family protein [Bifidobacterium scardovii]MDU5886034.1 nitroreductase family protein [Bifidobacterium scardovii]